MSQYTVTSITNGRIVGAVPSAKLLAAAETLGEVKAYRISRETERWCVEPDARLGYRDTDVVTIDETTVDAEGRTTVRRLGPARPA